MTKEELNNAYFEWIYRLVSGEGYSPNLSYRKLLNRLHTIDFVYIIPMDGNRAEDGMDLRYRFGYENGIESPLIATYLDCRPCSVLEMMAALSLRLEEQIMDDPDIGNRTGQWFWNMVENLGLGSMYDAEFDRDYVDYIIRKFMERDYEQNGEGGLFTVKNCRRDLRGVEIWYQACWYLNESA